jgi:hypothetical protein
MKNDSNGPTRILYWAMGALVVAVSVLTYFVSAGSSDGGKKAEIRLNTISAPISQ